MNCLAALYVTFAYCHVNLEIKVTRMHKNPYHGGWLRQCGFHQSDAAHHLHWGLRSLGSGVQCVGCCGALCVF